MKIELIDEGRRAGGEGGEQGERRHFQVDYSRPVGSRGRWAGEKVGERFGVRVEDGHLKEDAVVSSSVLGRISNRTRLRVLEFLQGLIANLRMHRGRVLGWKILRARTTTFERMTQRVPGKSNDEHHGELQTPKASRFLA